MKLYELTGDFAELFERFDEIDNWEPDTDEDGSPIDDNNSGTGYRLRPTVHKGCST